MADQDITNRVDIAGKRAVVALDYRHARIYAVDAPTHSKPEAVVAPDPWLLDHNLYHRAHNPDGEYDIDKIDTDAFFETLTTELQIADEVLLLGHGKGKANACHQFAAYLDKRHPSVAAKIVANVQTDIDDITDNQLLRLGEMYFGTNEPRRRYPDSHHNAPHAGQ